MLYNTIPKVKEIRYIKINNKENKNIFLIVFVNLINKYVNKNQYLFLTKKTNKYSNIFVFLRWTLIIFFDFP